MSEDLPKGITVEGLSDPIAKHHKIPTCPKCEISMLWCAYNKALWKTDPGPDHWICDGCGKKKYDRECFLCKEEITEDKPVKFTDGTYAHDHCYEQLQEYTADIAGEVEYD